METCAIQNHAGYVISDGSPAVYLKHWLCEWSILSLKSFQLWDASDLTHIAKPISIDHKLTNARVAAKGLGTESNGACMDASLICAHACFLSSCFLDALCDVGLFYRFGGSLILTWYRWSEVRSVSSSVAIVMWSFTRIYYTAKRTILSTTGRSVWRSG